MRWRIDVEYDGSAFVGWQVQPNGPSIQTALEDAILKLFGEQVRVEGSGRTDAGVHAEQQVAAFTVTVERSEKAVRDGLNAFLPAEVAVLRAIRVPDAFDPRRDVRTKCYRYDWLDRRARSPLWGGRAWHVRDRLDVQAMHEAAQAMVGKHDFTSFRAAGCQAAHPIRTILHAEVTRSEDHGGHRVSFRVHGHGFLRHMVRICAGTLLEVGRGAHTSRLAQAIAARRRDAAGRTAPARGLTLEWVRYGDEGVNRD